MRERVIGTRILMAVGIALLIAFCVTACNPNVSESKKLSISEISQKAYANAAYDPIDDLENAEFYISTIETPSEEQISAFSEILKYYKDQNSGTKARMSTQFGLGKYTITDSSDTSKTWTFELVSHLRKTDLASTTRTDMVLRNGDGDEYTYHEEVSPDGDLLELIIDNVDRTKEWNELGFSYTTEGLSTAEVEPEIELYMLYKLAENSRQLYNTYGFSTNTIANVNISEQTSSFLGSAVNRFEILSVSTERAVNAIESTLESNLFKGSVKFDDTEYGELVFVIDSDDDSTACSYISVEGVRYDSSQINLSKN